MKKRRQSAAFCLAVLILGALPLQAYAVNGAYGAAAVEENRTYTLNQMLTYAIQDEYLARARYTADIKKFGDQRPFTRIVEAERNHIALLKPYLERYQVPIPEDKASEYLVIPDTLLDAMKAGVAGESNNMRMYELFLKQELPDDVRAVFSVLRNAAGNHLRAFSRQVERLESGFAGRNR